MIGMLFFGAIGTRIQKQKIVRLEKRIVLLEKVNKKCIGIVQMMEKVFNPLHKTATSGNQNGVQHE